MKGYLNTECSRARYGDFFKSAATSANSSRAACKSSTISAAIKVAIQVFEAVPVQIFGDNVRLVVRRRGLLGPYLQCRVNKERFLFLAPQARVEQSGALSKR